MPSPKKLLFSFFLLSQTVLSFAQTVTLPLNLDNGLLVPYGLPSIKVQIQGQTIPLLLDTGSADGIVLSKNIIDRLKVNWTGKQRCSMTQSGKRCFATFFIPTLKLGSFILHDVQGSEITKEWGNWPYQTFHKTAAFNNGIVGLAVLRQFNLLIDEPRKRLVLISLSDTQHLYNTQDWLELPIQFAHQVNLFTPINYEGKTEQLAWDTAFIPAMLKSEPRWKQAAAPCSFQAELTDPKAKCVTVKHFTNQKYDFPATEFLLLDFPGFPFAGIVGATFFQQHVVLFNFERQKILVQP